MLQRSPELQTSTQQRDSVLNNDPYEAVRYMRSV
jgi:hypothetical protein